MLKHPIKFKDFNDQQREMDLYFNLSETELIEWSLESPEGVQREMEEAVKNNDKRRLLAFVKELIFRAYGERDSDGIHFHKSPEISRAFENSAMYNPLLLSLFADEGRTTANFITGLMPSDLVQRAMEKGAIPNPEAVDISSQYGPSARDIAAQNEAARDAAPLQVDRREDSAPDAAPVQISQSTLDEVRHVGVTPPEFRVKEEPLQPFGNPQSDEQAEFEEFKRRRAAGEL